MTTQTHQEEIISSRIGGFGGSDAKLFYKIGTKGIESLSNTDKRRIAVAKGLVSPVDTPKTKAMQKGHDFEDFYQSKLTGKSYWREYKAQYERAKNFNTFAHIDFYLIGSGTAIELKCVEDTTKAEKDYKAQLQWYYMLGAIDVQLVICDSTAETFEEGLLEPIKIERDTKYIDKLQKGINILDENWDSFTYEPNEEWTVNDLTTFEQKEVEKLANILQEMAEMEKRADEIRQRVKDMVEMYGINSIDSDRYSIKYIPESQSRSFDKAKLLKEHPEIEEENYTKISNKKSYITIKLKN